MVSHDPYMMKAIEYLVSLASLALFVVFWRFVNTEAAVAPERAAGWSGQLADWFRVPKELFFHPGHGWVKPEAAGVLTVGLDDFAQQLVGPLAAIDLPAPGTELRSGDKGWTLRAGFRTIDMRSPVTGTVVAVNDRIANSAALANDDPYGAGWLLKVRAPQGRHALGDLLSGQAARKWIAQVAGELTAAMAPQLGTVMQDGGVPVHGIARSLDEQHWDTLARRFLTTDHTDFTDPDAADRTAMTSPVVSPDI